MTRRYVNLAIEWLMLALLAFMPFAFGVVDAWSEEIVVSLSGIMLACLMVKMILRERAGLVWSWAYVPLALLILLIMVQITPISSNILALISPQTAALKTELLSDAPNANAALGEMTISFYPLATARALRLVLALAAVFVVAVNIFQHGRQIKRLLAVIAVIGAAVALLALMQILTGTEKLYWLVPTNGGPALSGPFLNHNNYCQFMNLSIAAALGLLLIKLEEEFQGMPVTLPSIIGVLSEKRLRWFWYLSGMIVLGIVTIFLSLSRSGMISMLVAAGIATFLLALQKRLRTRGWIMAAMAVFAFGSVLYLGFDGVRDRLVSLGQVREYAGRWQLSRETLAAWAKFPVLGTGLGTHEFVHPMFDGSNLTAKASHAENDYAQLAEETGLAGVAMAIMFGIAALCGYIRCAKSADPRVRAAAVGIGFGLAAVVVHSFVDFGQHLPANACLSAVFCGLLISMARKGWQQDESPAVQNSASTLSRLAAAAGFFCVFGIWAWSVTSVAAARRAEAHWYQARHIEKRISKQQWKVSNSDYAALISLAQKSVEAQPQNVLYRYKLNHYRWQSISRVTDSQTGDILLSPKAIRCVRHIADSLDRDRAICPTFGPNYSLAGQLKLFVLGQPRGAQLIHKGYVLSPCDPAACFAAGILDISEENIDDGFDKLQRAVRLDGTFFHDAADILIERAHRPDLAVELARDNATWLLKVAADIEKLSPNDELVAKARSRATELLAAQCEQPDVSAGLLALTADYTMRNGDWATAAAYYRRALAKNCSKLDWRLSFAECLAQSGRISEAIDQAHICLQLEPELPAAKELLVNLRSWAMGDLNN